MPGIVGAGCVLATQDWHRQNLLACWRVFLALPGIIGAGRDFATQRWQCQDLLAPCRPSPPRAGTARDFWRLSAPDAAPYASVRGSVTVIVVPSPGVLSQLIVPPSSSQMRLTMDSPNPLPPSTCERFAW